MVTQNFIPIKKSYKRSFILILLLISIYILENSSITTYIDSYVFNYILKPVLWIGIAFLALRFPHISPIARLKHRKLLNFWAFNFGIIYIIITIFASIIESLGKSPYNHSLKGILMNVLFVGSALIGREFIRSYLVNSFIKEENYLVIILIGLLMTIISFPVSKYIQFKNLEGAVIFIAQFFAPEFSHNIFATYLVFLGGPLTSIIYLSVIQGFHWFSPVLPDLKWITTALVGILCPIFFLMSLQTIYLSATKQLKKREWDEENPISWAVTSIISIIIIWFAVGVFPIYPSVIATGSMEPMIKPGDVILVKKIVDMDGINNLKIGDVIQFKRDGILISHRIINIENDEKEGIGFKTQGDNNSGPDIEIVRPQDVKGIITGTIPKIGWPTLLIKSDKEIPLEDIVY